MATTSPDATTTEENNDNTTTTAEEKITMNGPSSCPSPVVVETETTTTVNKNDDGADKDHENDHTAADDTAADQEIEQKSSNTAVVTDNDDGDHDEEGGSTTATAATTTATNESSVALDDSSLETKPNPVPEPKMAEQDSRSDTTTAHSSKPEETPTPNTSTATAAATTTTTTETPNQESPTEETTTTTGPSRTTQSTPPSPPAVGSSFTTAVAIGTVLASNHSQKNRNKNNTNNYNNEEDDDDDVTSKAAVALAAVAAAATANHKSPAEAAAQARAVAQTFLGSQHHNDDGTSAYPQTSSSLTMSAAHPPPPPPQWRRVRFPKVREKLQHRHATMSSTTTSKELSSLLDFISKGENVCFLQHLLLLEYFQCMDEDEGVNNNNHNNAYANNRGKEPSAEQVAAGEVPQQPETNAASSTDNKDSNENDDDDDDELATLAAERIIAVLKKVEGAYDSLLNLLPPYPPPTSKSNPATAGKSDSETDASSSDYETDSSVVVPDLLPPCTTAKGDSTLAFFRECCSSSHSTLDPQDGMDTAPPPPPPPPERAEDHSEHHHQPQGGKANSAAAMTSPGRTAVTSMFGMFRRASGGTTTGASSSSTTATSFMSSFRRSKENGGSGGGMEDEDSTTFSSESTSFKQQQQQQQHRPPAHHHHHHEGLRPGEYVVKIEREMLGLTVENVLERTVVRTVLAGGPAKKAGAKVGSLIVKVGNIETKHLTHFETIDELRQSQRPLILVLKPLSEESLRAAREEMGRLIRGAGFGTVVMDHSPSSEPYHHPSSTTSTTTSSNTTSDHHHSSEVRPLIAADLRLEAFTSYIRRRLAMVNHHHPIHPKKQQPQDEGVARAADKLIWILTLFVFGLEREIYKLPRQKNETEETKHDGTTTTNTTTASQPPTPQHSGSHLYQHTLKEYMDSAKSAAKVLLDFTRKRTNAWSNNNNNNNKGGNDIAAEQQPRRRKGGGPPPPPPPPLPGRGGGLRRGKGGRSSSSSSSHLEDSNIAHEKPLLQIGDVLQRTRTFLADTTSPPAALLRGEVIAVLCDILDVDVEMEMSEEESISATSGAQAGPINDLGSAGSLLKLIVLNCPTMRSPICEELSGKNPVSSSIDAEWAEELRRKLGKNKEVYSSQELHRLHAGNRFLAVVHRLAASRSMSARITACSLGPVIWGHLDFPHQLQLRGVITRALHDVEVMVRKATANVLHEIAELVFDARCVPWLVLMCERSMTDPEPQMRSAAMTLTWHLAEHLPNTFLGDASQGSRYLRRLPDRNDPIFADVYLLQCKLLPVATRLAEDRSPSVRLAVAAQCDRLCDALGDHWSSVVIDVLLGLLSDPDERVRCEAVMCVPRLAGIVLLSSPPGASVSEVSILEALVPASIRLQNDTVSVVRVALASAAGELLTLLVALQRQTEESLPPAAAAAVDNNTATSNSSSSSSSGGGVTNEVVYRRYKKQVDERLVPLVQTLLNDQDPEVTSAALRAVTNASRRSTTLPSSASQRHRLPSYSAGDDDSASVTSLHSHTSRENRQPVFLPVLSEVQVLRLLPTLSELADSKQWRVRQSAVEIVPALLGCTQKLETRTEISHLCVRLMSDKVDEVRKTAAECLCMGGSNLGSHGEDASAEWFYRIVIPVIRRCATHQNSKQRLLSLKMVEIILLNGACPTKVIPQVDGGVDAPPTAASPTSELVSTALSLCDDRIANVRLNVGRILESVLHVLGSDDLSKIVECVDRQLQNERANGNDRDVLFFASRCTTRARAMREDMVADGAGSLVTL